MGTLQPGQASDELFYCEQTRAVRVDNTFSFGGKRHEAPRDLRGREVVVRFDPTDEAARLVVYLGGERMGQARPLDLVANDRAPVEGGRP